MKRGPNMHRSHTHIQQHHPGTHDAHCPPFLEVLSYLFCIIFSFAMIGYILLWLSYWKPDRTPVEALVSFLAFGGMILYSCAKLGQVLFPAWWRKPEGSVVVKVLEID
jgi:hypothetical protein